MEKNEASETMEYKVRIREIPKEERPRERLFRLGAGSLSDAELLAILLRTGSKKENVLNLASRILRDYNLKELSNTNVSKLRMIYGISDAKACQIVSCFELGRRAENFKEEEKWKIKSSLDVYDLIRGRTDGIKKEVFFGIHLNTKNFLLKCEEISVGSLSANIVHPREVFKSAVEISAAGIILAHNHPSGDPSPSEEDVKLTKRLAEAGEVMGIKVLDHVIIGDKKFVSLKEQGVL